MKKALFLNLKFFLILFLTTIISFFVSFSFSEDVAILMALLIYLGIIVCVSIIRKADLISTEEFRGRDNFKKYFLTLLYFLPLIVLLHVFLDPIANLNYILGIEKIDSQGDIRFDYSILFVLYGLFFAPIVEEIFFRKYLLVRTLELSKKKVFSVVITSMVFGLVHFPYPSLMMATFILGLFCALIYLSTKKIVQVILFHFLFNLYTFICRTFYFEEYYHIIKSLSFGYYYWSIVLLSGVLLIILSLLFFNNVSKINI